MKIIIFIFALLSLSFCTKWAVLVAGSNTYGNYRHQADVYHAYKLLTKNHISANNIITLAYNDIANNPSNPFPGKVFNKPSYALPGKDVYAGVAIDYSGADVNPTTFLNVITGNAAALAGVGTGRSLQSNANDSVFIFFADHGATGLIAFPSSYLYANQLLGALNTMQANNKFKKLVFYLEACQSGSMFVSLPTNTKIYAVTASSPFESSWATYCGANDVVNNVHIGSCLGDLFSVSFLEETQTTNIFTESLNTQFNKVKALVTASQVNRYGDQSFVNSSTVGNFLGNQLFIPIGPIILPIPYYAIPIPCLECPIYFDSRTTRLQLLTQQYQSSSEIRHLSLLEQELESIRTLDATFAKFQATHHLTGTEYDIESIDFRCLKTTLESYERRCGRLTDYGLKYVKLFAEACQTVGSAIAATQARQAVASKSAVAPSDQRQNIQVDSNVNASDSSASSNSIDASVGRLSDYILTAIVC